MSGSTLRVLAVLDILRTYRRHGATAAHIATVAAQIGHSAAKAEIEGDLRLLAAEGFAEELEIDGRWQSTHRSSPPMQARRRKISRAIKSSKSQRETARRELAVKWRAMLERGMTMQEIADAEGTSRQNVSRFFQRWEQKLAQGDD